MNIPVVPTVLIAGAITMAGIISKKKKVPPGVLVGLAVLTLALAFMDNISAELAQGFALLVLVGAIWIYVPDLTKALNRAGVK